MKKVWIQSNDSGAYEDIAPKTLADQVYMDDTQTQTVLQAIQGLNSGGASMRQFIAELDPAEWTDKRQTVSAPVTVDSTIWVSYAFESKDAYGMSGIHAAAQNEGEIVFACEIIPDVPIFVNIAIA